MQLNALKNNFLQQNFFYICIFKKIHLSIIFVFCLIVSAPTMAKLTIHGNISENFQLVEALNQFTKKDLQDPKHNLSKIHNKWLIQIVDLVKEYKNSNNNIKNIAIPHDHPVRFFSKKDAYELIRPLLKNMYNLDLSDEIINDLFQKQFLYKPNGNKRTSLVYFRKNEIKKETYNAAKKVFSIAKGNTILTLGQTPLLITEMLKGINVKAKDSEKINIINLPYSGHPDTITLHTHKDGWFNTFKNILTANRLSNYKNFLESLGFSPKKIKNKKIFILDDTSGPSLKTFLIFLCKWCEQEKVIIPDISFINMKSKDKIYYIKEGKWERADKSKPLALNIDEQTRFEIDTYYLDMNAAIVYNMLEICDNLRSIAPMHAINWNLDIKNLLIKHYPKKNALKLLRKYYLYALNHYNGNGD